MTSIEQVATLATFAAVWAVLSVGHNLADHVIGQTDRQAAGKAAPSAAEVADGVSPRRGWGACLGHCLTYTATQAIVAGAGARALGIRVHPAAAAAALALSFGTHYAADRRVPGKGLLEKIATQTGKGGFYKLADFGINGAFHLDSAWHHGWETVAALIATTKSTTR